VITDAIGLGLVSVAMRAGFDLSAALGLMSLLSIVGAALILAFPETRSREAFPETRSREVEAISE
jgi:hypothetical protein